MHKYNSRQSLAPQRLPSNKGTNSLTGLCNTFINYNYVTYCEGKNLDSVKVR